MKRNITNKINYLLDNWTFPILRDSKLFMGLAMRIVLGKKYKYYMEFKEKINELSEEEINKYYEILQDTFISRDTDLNDASIKFILEHISGNTVLDAAMGRGFLAEKIYEKGCYQVSGLDIVPPKVEDGIHVFSGTLTDLPFKDKQFDTVVCTHALEHIKDKEKALSELRHVTKKTLIIVVPRQREYKYTFDLHINFFPYLYNLKNYINNPNAFYKEIGHDWLCMEEYRE